MAGNSLTRQYLGEKAEVGNRLTVLRQSGQYLDGDFVREGRDRKKGLYLQLRQVEVYAKPGDTPRPVSKDIVTLLGTNIETIVFYVDDSIADLDLDCFDGDELESW